MILLGGVHHALEGVDAAEPLLELTVLIAQELEARGNPVAGEQIVRSLLLLDELQIGEAGANQHGGAAEELADRLTEIVLDVGAGISVTDREPEPLCLMFRQPPPEPPDED